MNWIKNEIDSRRLTEKKKDTEKSGTVSRYVVRVSVNGVTMKTAVFAENFKRARSIAEKLFGKGNVKTQPVKS
jgi:hypothetical protein